MEYILSILQTYSDAFKTKLVERALTAMSYLHSIDYYAVRLSKVYAIDNLISYLESKEVIDQSTLDGFFIILAKNIDKYLLCLGITTYDNVAISKKIELLEFVYSTFTLDQNLSTQLLQVLETDNSGLQKFCTMMMEYTGWVELDVVETIQELDSSIIYALEETYRNIETKIDRQQDEHDTSRVF